MGSVIRVLGKFTLTDVFLGREEADVKKRKEI